MKDPLTDKRTWSYICGFVSGATVCLAITIHDKGNLSYSMIMYTVFWLCFMGFRELARGD